MSNSLIGNLEKVVMTSNLLDTLKIENKSKCWSNSVIKVDIVDNKFITNANEIEVVIKSASEKVIDFVENTTSVLEVTAKADEIKLITDWLIGTRRELTQPFDMLKKSFTKNEDMLKKMLNLCKDKIEILNENIFIKRAEAINEKFQILINDDKLDINLSVFSQFVMNKRRLQAYKLNNTGLLSNTAHKHIQAEYNLVALPLKELREKAILQEKEQSDLSTKLASIKTNGSFEELSEQLVILSTIRDSINFMYPNNCNSAISQVANYVSIIKSAIVSLENTKKSTEEAPKKQDIATPVPAVDVVITKSEYKVVDIDVSLSFRVKNHIPSDKIIEKLKAMLSKAGINDSIQNIKVV